MATRKPAPKPAPKPAVLRRPAINPFDAVRNPNFGAAMAQQNYFNNLSRLVAERNARGPEYGLMPIGNPEDARRMEAAMAERNAALTSGTAQPVNDPEFIDSRQPGSNYTANMINYVDPATGQMVARTAGIIPRAGSRFVPVDRFGQTPNPEPKAPRQPRPSPEPGLDRRPQPYRPSQPSPGPMINPETLNKARDEYVKQNPGEVNRRVTQDMIGSRYLGPIGRSMSGFDKWFETNYINNPNSSLTAQERASIIPERYTQQEKDALNAQRREALKEGVGMGGQQGPQAGGGEGLNYKGQQFYASEQPGYGDPYFQGSQRYQEREDYQNFLKQGGQRPPQGPQVGVGSFGDTARRLEQSGQLPYQQPFNPNAPSLMPIRTPGSGAQNQQMQNYNNLLQQGIQRSNTMNQDAASNFANMQAGAPTTQPAAPAKANPVVPIAGMGMQQPKATPAPRKFSTVNTPSARFF
jgi:hypothetical protein